MVKFQALISFLIKQWPGQMHQDLSQWRKLAQPWDIWSSAALTSSSFCWMVSGAHSSFGRKWREGQPGDLPASWSVILFNCGIAKKEKRKRKNQGVFFPFLTRILSDHLNILANRTRLVGGLALSEFVFSAGWNSNKLSSLIFPEQLETDSATGQWCLTRALTSCVVSWWRKGR